MPLAVNLLPARMLKHNYLLSVLCCLLNQIADIFLDGRTDLENTFRSPLLYQPVEAAELGSAHVSLGKNASVSVNAR